MDSRPHNTTQSKTYVCIAKVLCPLCLIAKKEGRINKNCSQCRWIKHHVNNLLKYTEYLDREWPNWVFFTVYEHRKDGMDGAELARFKNWHKEFKTDPKTGKKYFIGVTRDIPTRKTL